MIVLVGLWDWFAEKAETWSPSELALVIMALGVASFLSLCGIAVVIWSMS